MIKRNRIKAVILSAVIALTLAACMTKMSIRSEFEDSINTYNKLLAAQGFDAAGFFAAEAIEKEFGERIKAAKKIRVVDYRIVKTKYDEENGKAEVAVEIDYYSLSSYKANTILDIQRWSYVTEKDVAHWRLMSILPEFP